MEFQAAFHSFYNTQWKDNAFPCAALTAAKSMEIGGSFEHPEEPEEGSESADLSAEVLVNEAGLVDPPETNTEEAAGGQLPKLPRTYKGRLKIAARRRRKHVTVHRQRHPRALRIDGTSISFDFR